MNCPNCGTYYDENEKICKKCHTPLSNAVYNQVSSGNDINQPAPKRKSFVPIVAAILICCLIAGGIGGYFYYIRRADDGYKDELLRKRIRPASDTDSRQRRKLKIFQKAD